MSTPNDLNILPVHPQDLYKVSPGLPDLIPIEWRSFIERNKLCDTNVKPLAVTKNLLQFKASQAGLTNTPEMTVAKIVWDLSSCGVLKHRRLIDWINLYATFHQPRFHPPGVVNYTDKDGSSETIPNIVLRYGEANSGEREKLQILFTKILDNSHNEKLLIEFLIQLDDIIEEFVGRFGFVFLGSLSTYLRHTLVYAEGYTAQIKKIHDCIEDRTTLAFQSMQGKVIEIYGADNIISLSKSKSVGPNLVACYTIKPGDKPQKLEDLFLIDNTDITTHFSLLRDLTKNLQNNHELSDMQPGEMEHKLTMPDGLNVECFSSYDEDNKTIKIRGIKNAREGKYDFIFDGTNLLVISDINPKISLVSPKNLKSPWFPKYELLARASYLFIAAYIGFERTAYKNIDAKIGEKYEPTDNSHILFEIIAKTSQNPGDFEIFMSLLLSRMSPVTVDAHRKGRQNQVLQITEKSGFYHRPPAIFVRQAIGFPSQEQRSLAQRYGQKLHAYIGKVDTRTMKAYERMDLVKSAFDTEALQSLPLNERLEKIRQLYSTNPDHIASKSIADITAIPSGRGGFQPLFHAGIPIEKFSLERLSDDDQLINFFYERAWVLIDEIESDMLSVKQETMAGLSEEETQKYDKIGDSLRGLRSHFFTQDINKEGKKQSILALQNALTRVGGELSREFLAKLTGFVYLFECENIRKNIDDISPQQEEVS